MKQRGRTGGAPGSLSGEAHDVTPASYAIAGEALDLLFGRCQGSLAQSGGKQIARVEESVRVKARLQFSHLSNATVATHQLQ